MTSKRGKKFQIGGVFKWLKQWANIRNINSSHHIHPVTNHPMSEGTISSIGPGRGNTSQRSNFSGPSATTVYCKTLTKGKFNEFSVETF